MLPYLPYELEELILRHLQHDPPTLKACSLACYRFGIICQRFLFDNIVVRFSSSSPNTLKKPTSSVCPFLLHAFLEATPRIAKSVRGIDIIADSYRLQNLDTTYLPCPSFLENLRSISLDTDSARPIYWRHLSIHAQRSLYSISRSSQIVNMRFRRVFELPISLIAECPALEGLSLISVTFQQESMLQLPENPSYMSQPPRLRSLHLSISTEAFRTFIDALAGSSALLDLSALVKLSVSIFSMRFDYNRLNSFLRTVGNSLEVLCFSPMALDTAEQRPPLHLHVLPRLRTLRLRALSSDGSDPSKIRPQSAESQPIRLLMQPKAQSLEEVSIKADFGRALGMRMPDGDLSRWAAIDAALGALPSIRKVTAFACGEYAEPQPSALAALDIARVFPRLHSKSLVRVQPACATLGFLAEANETDLLSESFRRHNMI